MEKKEQKSSKTKGKKRRTKSSVTQVSKHFNEYLKNLMNFVENESSLCILVSQLTPSPSIFPRMVGCLVRKTVSDSLQISILNSKPCKKCHTIFHIRCSWRMLFVLVHSKLFDFVILVSGGVQLDHTVTSISGGWDKKIEGNRNVMKTLVYCPIEMFYSRQAYSHDHTRPCVE